MASKSKTGGFLAGLAIFCAAAVMLFWNESRTVKVRGALIEFAASADDRAVDSLSPDADGKAAHFSGKADASGDATDPLFEISADALKLRRRVEMYQWVEKSRTEKDSSGDERRVYRYELTWEDSPQNSANYNRSGYDNPPFPFRGESFYAASPSLGAYQLRSEQIDDIGGSSLDVPAELPSKVRSQGFRADGNRYVTGNSASPQLGDVRVEFRATAKQPISVIGTSKGDQIVPFVAGNGVEVYRLDAGVSSREAMVAAEHSGNETLKWGLRGGGWAAMVLGMSMALSSLVAFFSRIPLIGPMVERTAVGVGFILGSIGAIAVITVAWFVVRPVLSIAVLVLTAVAAYFAFRRPQAPRSSMPPPPPPPAAA